MAQPWQARAVVEFHSDAIPRLKAMVFIVDLGNCIDEEVARDRFKLAGLTFPEKTQIFFEVAK